jgi:histidyl-tRNA synthetase
MFRYERPQKGRFRQFHQFGVESFGESNHFEDLNLILLLKSILDYFNINYKLKINSLGCDKCLLPFKEELVGFLDKHIDGFCEDCKKRKQTNPIRVFDCKNEKCQDILKDAKKLNDSLCNECDEHFEALKKELNNLQIPYEVDSNLVRGLDYYTKTAFEFVSDELGAQSAIAGGGRYDKLVSVLGGKETKAVGFAIGLERIFELLEPQQFDTKKIYIGTMLEDVVSSINKLSYILRQKYEVDISYEAKSLKAHLKKADKIGARYFIFIGEDELKQNKLWLKNLVTKEEKLVNAKELQSVLA